MCLKYRRQKSFLPMNSTMGRRQISGHVASFFTLFYLAGTLSMHESPDLRGRLWQLATIFLLWATFSLPIKPWEFCDLAYSVCLLLLCCKHVFQCRKILRTSLSWVYILTDTSTAVRIKIWDQAHWSRSPSAKHLTIYSSLSKQHTLQ